MTARKTFGGGGPLVYCLVAVVASLTLGPVAYGALGGFRSNEQLARDPAGLPDPWVFGNYLGDLGAGATNVLMTGCDFRAIAPQLALLYSPSDLRIDNCRFRQLGTRTSYPNGIHTGVTRIDSAGPVSLGASRFLGRVIVNGEPVG